MAKEKAVKVAGKKDKPEKKQKSSKPASSKAKAAGLSEERVVDSDSEVETPKPVAASPKKEKKSKTKAAPPPPPPKEPTPAASSDEESEESESGSNDEEDEDEDMPDAPVLKKPDTVPAKVNGVKRKADKGSSGEESDSSEEESDSSEQPEAKRAKTSEEEQSGSGEDDSSEEEDDSSEDQSSKEKEPTKASVSKPATAVGDKSIPAQPFKPPHGYNAVQIQSAAISASSFSGKQIWHITAPSKVPLKEVTELAQNALQNGSTVLNHKGIDYILAEDANHSTQFDRVMVPSKDGYEIMPQKISKSLHLQQKIVLPNLSRKQADTASGSNAAADIAQPSISTARPQPKGMRMRYKPPGFGAGDPGLGSESEGDVEVQSKTSKTSKQFPKTLGGAQGAAEQPENAGTTEKSKKSKKKRKDEDVEMVNGDLVPPPSGQPQRKPVDVLPDRSGTGKSGEEEDLSKEEKKKRKAEKKARKEAKAGAKTES